MSVGILRCRMNVPAIGTRLLRERGARLGVDVTEAIAEELAVTATFWRGRRFEIKRSWLMPLCRCVGKGA